jgi:ComF family protein
VFFGEMSNSSVLRTLRLPISWATHLFDQDCALCGSASRDRLVCVACDRALPRLRVACARCAAPLAQAGLCGECLRGAPAFDEAAAAFEYRFPVDRLVQRFKAAGDLAIGRWLALQLLERVRPAERPDRIVAPPLSREKLRRRGFNQALEIAKHVGRALRVPVDLAALEKVRDTPAQQGLTRRERRANLRGAFRCARRFEGEHVAIIDDVVTTAATANALARLLKRAGAARVSVWAVARTPGAPPD